MTRFLIIFTACAFVTSGVVSEKTMAHSIFKKSMEKAYPIMKISCNSCHIKGEKKTERSDFGELFFKEMKADKVTETWKAAKSDGRDAQKAYEKETMVPLFEKVLKKVKESTVPEVEGVTNPDSGKTWHEMISTEKIDGISVDQRKKEKLEKEAAEKDLGN